MFCVVQANESDGFNYRHAFWLFLVACGWIPPLVVPTKIRFSWIESAENLKNTSEKCFTFAEYRIYIADSYYFFAEKKCNASEINFSFAEILIYISEMHFSFAETKKYTSESYLSFAERKNNTSERCFIFTKRLR